MDLTLPNDFKEFLRLLNSYQVEYLLIGGYAVGYHGYPRATNDMDVWVAIHPDNAERLINVMQAFGFSVPELTAELFLQEQKIIRMGNPPMRIELLTSISGVSFTEITPAGSSMIWTVYRSISLHWTTIAEQTSKWAV